MRFYFSGTFHFPFSWKYPGGIWNCVSPKAYNVPVTQNDFVGGSHEEDNFSSFIFQLNVYDAVTTPKHPSRYHLPSTNTSKTAWARQEQQQPPNILLTFLFVFKQTERNKVPHEYQSFSCNEEENQNALGQIAKPEMVFVF